MSVACEIRSLEVVVDAEYVGPFDPGEPPPGFVTHVLDCTAALGEWQRDGVLGRTAIAPGPMIAVIHQRHAVRVHGVALTEAIVGALERRGALRPTSAIASISGYRERAPSAIEAADREELGAMAKALSGALIYMAPELVEARLRDHLEAAYRIGRASARPTMERAS